MISIGKTQNLIFPTFAIIRDKNPANP